ncbi:hypothetical protein SRIMM317S_02720 [Streptomyces rimosus subsp. rimosus]
MTPESPGLFTSDMGGQISWLLPAAFLLLVAGLVVLRRARRTDAARAAFLVWGGALLMTFTTFSFMSGIFHQYYNVALAPYIAALVAMGATLLWQRRARTAAALLLAGTVAVTAGWAYVLLARSPQWMPWLRWTVVAVGAVAALGLLLSVRLGRRLAVVAAGLGIAAGLGGPVAYAANTVNTPHTGSIVTAGPEVRGAGGRHGGMIIIGGRGPGPGGKGGRNHGGTAGPPPRPGSRPGPGPRHTRRQGPQRPRRPPDRPTVQRQGQGRPQEERRRPHLGRRRDRLPERRELPVGHRSAGHAHRRLQRQRPVTDPGTV